METDSFLEFRRQTLSQVRRCSDVVRSEQKLRGRDRSITDYYLASNQSYFEENVLAGQLVQSDTAARVVGTDQEQDSYYATDLHDLGKLRTTRGNVSGFEVLHPAFLEPIAQQFFIQLDHAKTFETEEQFLQWLAVADFALQVLHPVKDGTGRSGEDLLALLSHSHGYPLTFSLTGYRAALDTPDRDLFHRHVTERVGFTELVQVFLRSAGLNPGTARPWQIVEVLEYLKTHFANRSEAELGWPDDLTIEIDARTKPRLEIASDDQGLLRRTHPYWLYASFLFKELTYLLICLEDIDRHFPAVLTRYPLSMGCRLTDMAAARRNNYTVITPSLTAATDDVMARIDLLRLGKLDRNNADLTRGLAQIKDWNADLGALFARERDSQSMEKLLQRLRVPKGWALSPQDFRTTVNQTMDWSI